MFVFKITGWGFDQDEVVFFQIWFFDWGCIRICEGWGCIQDWVCIQADTADYSYGKICEINFNNSAADKHQPT